MKIGYARVSKNDGSQTVALQTDALIAAGVGEKHIYTDHMSGKVDHRPGLESCLKALREGDILVVWKLDRLGRSLKHLVETAEGLERRSIGFKVLSGLGANIDTTTPEGKLMFSMFAALAEFERKLIQERTLAGLEAARKRGRLGGRPSALTKKQVKLAQSALANPDTVASDLCDQLGVSKTTLYKYVAPSGTLRPRGESVINGAQKRGRE